MGLLQPADAGRDRGGARLDAAVIGIQSWRRRDGVAGRIVEKQDGVIVQCALVLLQRQGIVAALIGDLGGDRALAVERVRGHDRALQRQHRQQFGHRGDLV